MCSEEIYPTGEQCKICHNCSWPSDTLGSTSVGSTNCGSKVLKTKYVCAEYELFCLCHYSLNNTEEEIFTLHCLHLHCFPEDISEMWRFNMFQRGCAEVTWNCYVILYKELELLSWNQSSTQTKRWLYWDNKPMKEKKNPWLRE